MVMLLTGAHGAVAADCRDTDLAAGGIRAATVRPGPPRVFFVGDADVAPGCPREAAGCRGKAFVVPGDAVLLGVDVQDGFVCATFSNARGVATTGRLPLSALVEDSAVPGAAPADWTGRWAAEEGSISITAAAGGLLKVKGDATWGAGDPDRVRRGGVHTGELDATAAPSQGVLAFTMGDDATWPYEKGDGTYCRVRMLRRGPYLVAKDNGQCGGANVSFTGLYRRRG